MVAHDIITSRFDYWDCLRNLLKNYSCNYNSKAAGLFTGVRSMVGITPDILAPYCFPCTIQTADFDLYSQKRTQIRLSEEPFPPI